MEESNEGVSSTEKSAKSPKSPRSRVLKLQKKINKEINKELVKEKKKMENEVKLLLLGNWTILV